MNIAAVCNDYYFPTFLTKSSGEGLDQESSKILDERLIATFSSLWKDEPMSRGSILQEAKEELYEIYLECNRENWDGYGAEAINFAAIMEALNIIEILPSSIDLPAIVPEPNGGIGFEWRVGNEKAVVISVTGRRIINYAGIFSGGRFHGSEYFEESLPSSIFNLFRRLSL